MARIIVNPDVFSDDRDAKCVAWNEAFRVVMEKMQFNPQSEPTRKQREFLSTTEYRNDETMMRRTILARICTFDTSVSDPTDEQLDEALEFLDAVMKSGAPQNEDEQSTVQRIRDVIAKVPRGKGGEPEAPAEPPAEEAPQEGSPQEAPPGEPSPSPME